VTVVWRLLRDFERSGYDLEAFYEDGRVRSGRKVSGLTAEVKDWLVSQDTLESHKLLSLKQRLMVIKDRFNIDMSDWTLRQIYKSNDITYTKPMPTSSYWISRYKWLEK